MPTGRLERCACGGIATKDSGNVRTGKGAEWMWWARCTKCGAEGPRMDWWDKAALAWNKTHPDPRDPDHSRPGVFAYHRCAGCDDGRKPCRESNPHSCGWPRARND